MAGAFVSKNLEVRAAEVRSDSAEPPMCGLGTVPGKVAILPVLSPFSKSTSFLVHKDISITE